MVPGTVVRLLAARASRQLLPIGRRLAVPGSAIQTNRGRNVWRRWARCGHCVRSGLGERRYGLLRLAGTGLRVDARVMSITQPWLTTTDIAEELGVSPETVRRRIRSGLLRARAMTSKDTGRITFRISRPDFEDYQRTWVKDTATDDWEV